MTTLRPVAVARHVALLRGINVGGHNKIAMADLRTGFESDGHRDIRTYIQSGNVVFSADDSKATSVLETEIERMLEHRYDTAIAVVVRSLTQFRHVVTKSPAVFVQESHRYHCDVIFLKESLTVAHALQAVERRDGVDLAWPGRGVLYFARLSERRSESRLSRIVGRPEYQRMTIRNWNTTTKLLTLANESLDPSRP